MLNTLSGSVGPEAKAILFDPENYTLASYFYSSSGANLVADIVFVFTMLLLVTILSAFVACSIIPNSNLKSGKTIHDVILNIISGLAIVIFSISTIGSLYYNLHLKPEESPTAVKNLSPFFEKAVASSDISLKNDLKEILISRDCLELYSLLNSNCHPTYVKFLMANKSESDNKLSKLANPSNYLDVYLNGILAGTYDFNESIKALKQIDSFKAISLEELVVEKLTKASSVEHTNVELIQGLRTSAGNLVEGCKSVSGLNCILFKKYFTAEVKKLNISSYYTIAANSPEKNAESVEYALIDKNFKLAILDLHRQIAEQVVVPSSKK